MAPSRATAATRQRVAAYRAMMISMKTASMRVLRALLRLATAVCVVPRVNVSAARPECRRDHVDAEQCAECSEGDVGVAHS